MLCCQYCYVKKTSYSYFVCSFSLWFIRCLSSGQSFYWERCANRLLVLLCFYQYKITPTIWKAYNRHCQMPSTDFSAVDLTDRFSCLIDRHYKYIQSHDMHLTNNSLFYGNIIVTLFLNYLFDTSSWQWTDYRFSATTKRLLLLLLCMEVFCSSLWQSCWIYRNTLTVNSLWALFCWLIASRLLSSPLRFVHSVNVKKRISIINISEYMRWHTKRQARNAN